MLRNDEQFVYDTIENEGGLPEVDDAVNRIIEYRQTDFYERKKLMIAQWEIDHKNIYDLVISIFTACLQTDYITYQAMVGMLEHKIKLSEEMQRVEIIADIIGLVICSGLIEITSQQGEKHLISTPFTLGGEAIPQDDKHATITDRPQPIESNWDKEYGFGSVILGHKMNHHEEYVRLSHLNRMAQTPFRINPEFIERYEEAPKKAPDTEEKWDQWEVFQADSLEKYNELIASDSRFFIRPNYDNRGRSYFGSYYVNPQGNSFKKGAIELAEPEVVEGF